MKPSRPDAVGTRELSKHVGRIERLLSRPQLPEWDRRNFFPGLQLHRRAPLGLAGEDEIGQRVVGRAVPFLPARGARTKMDVFVDSEGLFHILDSRHRCPVQELVVGKIKAIKVSVLRRHRHEPLASPRLDQSRRVGDVPVVPIPGHKLEMVLVSAGLGIEDNDGAGEEIVPLADAVVVVGRGIADGHIQEPRSRVQGRRGPGSPAADRSAGRVFPSRIVERRGAQGPANYIALGLGHEEELPHNLAGLGVERVHVPFAALEVSAGVADEDETLPGDRCCRHIFGLFRVPDRRLPEPLASFEVIGQHAPVLCAAEQHAVEVRRAPIGRQKVGRIFLVRAPVLGAGRRVYRENIEFGCADERALDHQKTGLEGR